MTTFRSGNLSAVCVNNIDASPYLNNASWTGTIDTADVTHFGDRAKEYIVGLSDGKVSLAGMYDALNIVSNPTGISVDSVFNGLDSIVGNFPTTLFLDGGIAVGRRCRIGNGILADYSISAPIGGVVSVKVDVQVSDNLHGAYCLTDGVGLTTAAAHLYTAIDNGATHPTTPGGLTATFHIPANTWTGTTSVKVQHSPDNSTFTDLITQTVPANTQAGYILPFVGTVNRYVRCSATPATGSGSITIVAAFARN